MTERKTEFLSMPEGGNVTPEQIQASVDSYLDQNPVQAGATAEQAAQIEQNAEDIAELNSDIVNHEERIELIESGGVSHVQTTITGKNITLETPVSGKDISIKFNGEVRFGYSGGGNPSPTNIRNITPITKLSVLRDGTEYSVQLNNSVGIGTIENGVLTVTHGIYVIDGVNNKVASASGTFNKTISDMKVGNAMTGYTDWLPTVSVSSVAGIRFGANNSQVYIYKMSDVIGTTATEANAYFAEHPLTIVYPLATERIISISDLIIKSNGSDVLSSEINMNVTYWKQGQKEDATDKTLTKENVPADAKATGVAIENVSNSVSEKVAEYFDEHPEIGDIETQFIDSNSVIEYGSELISDSNVTFGANWSGNFADGFTHATGSTEPITINVGTIDDTCVYAFNITTSNARLDGYSDFYVSLCGSETFETYKGGGSSVSYVFGLICGNDGTGNLVITPKKDYVGTITCLSLKKIETVCIDYTTVFTDSDGNNISEIRVNGFDNGLLSIGLDSGKNNFFGANNTAIGKNSLVKNTDGFWNTSLGYNTLNKCVHGSRNVAVGFIALQGLTTGDRNIAIGSFAMEGLTNGRNNIAIGADAMQTGNGNGNICIGTGSGGKGNFNTSVGYRSGNSVSGQKNIFIGWGAGDKATTGGGNIIIGAETNLDSPTDTNTTLIGRTNTKKTRVYGDFEVQGTDGIKRKIMFNEDGTCSWVQV